MEGAGFPMVELIMKIMIEVRVVVFFETLNMIS